VDVLIASFSLKRVASIDARYFIPVVGGRDDGEPGITTPCECRLSLWPTHVTLNQAYLIVYTDDNVSFAVIQQRSPVLKVSSFLLPDLLCHPDSAPFSTGSEARVRRCFTRLHQGLGRQCRAVSLRNRRLQSNGLANAVRILSPHLDQNNRTLAHQKHPNIPNPSQRHTPACVYSTKELEFFPNSFLYIPRCSTPSDWR
jgi:hypothetical protein